MYLCTPTKVESKSILWYHLLHSNPLNIIKGAINCMMPGILASTLVLKINETPQIEFQNQGGKAKCVRKNNTEVFYSSSALKLCRE